MNANRCGLVLSLLALIAGLVQLPAPAQAQGSRLYLHVVQRGLPIWTGEPMAVATDRHSPGLIVVTTLSDSASRVYASQDDGMTWTPPLEAEVGTVGVFHSGSTRYFALLHPGAQGQLELELKTELAQAPVRVEPLELANGLCPYRRTITGSQNIVDPQLIPAGSNGQLYLHFECLRTARPAFAEWVTYTLRSTDEGRTWERLEAPFQAPAQPTTFHVSRRDPAIIFQISGAVPQAWTSPDTGTTWESIDLPYFGLATTTMTDTTMYAFAPLGGMTSYDRGRTWAPWSGSGACSEIDGQAARDVVVARAATDVLIARCVDEQRVGSAHVSVDGGQTWGPTTSEWPLNVTALFADEGSPERVWALARHPSDPAISGLYVWSTTAPVWREVVRLVRDP